MKSMLFLIFICLSINIFSCELSLDSVKHEIYLKENLSIEDNENNLYILFIDGHYFFAKLHHHYLCPCYNN